MGDYWSQSEVPQDLESDTAGCTPLENCSLVLPAPDQQISVIGYRYCNPVIGVCGVCGSLLLLLALRRPCFTTGVFTYLRALMASDAAMLVFACTCTFSDSYRQTARCDGRLFTARSLLVARLRIYLLPIANTMAGLSIGLVLWMTYDRYVAVSSACDLWNQRRPLRRRCCCRRSVRVAGTLLLSALLHLPQLLCYKAVRHCPDVPAQLADFYELQNNGGITSSVWWTLYQWLLQLVVRWVPALVVLFCNLRIITAIARRSRRERRLRAADRRVFRLAVDTASDRSRSRCVSDAMEMTRSSRVTEQAPPLPLPPAAVAESPSACCSSVGQQQQQQRRKRRDGEHRLEVLLAAMATSLVVSSTLQSAVIILDLVYHDNDSFHYQFQVRGEA